MLGFDGSEIKRTTSKTSPFDRLCSLELLTAIKRQRHQKKKDVIRHAESFRLLRTADQEPVERIYDVLEYHIKNLHNKYHPLALSGPTFRKKFIQIEAAFLRAHPQRPTITITEEAKAIIRRLSMMGWKKGSLDLLPAEVQLSLDFTDALRKTLNRLVSKSSITNQFIKTLAQRLPRNWVEIHYEQLHRQLHGWESWSGQIESFRLTLQSKTARTKLLTILQEYGGEQAGKSQLEIILKEIDENRET